MKFYSPCLLLLVVVCIGTGSGYTQGFAATRCCKTSISANPEDFVILRVALNHFISIKNAGIYATRKGADSVLVAKKTPGKSDMLGDRQVSRELRKGLSLSSQLLLDLRQRNVKPVAIDGMRNRDKKIIVARIDRFSGGIDFWPAVQKRHPRAKAYARTWLPGYSRDGKQAVVRFSFGPTAHGAIATYMLVKRDKQWAIKWHNLAFYA